MLEVDKIIDLGTACGALTEIRARWQKFPCSRMQGTRRLGPRERAGLETLASPKAGIWTTSLYFPCGSGIRAQRRVRDRLHPPPPSLRVRRLPARTPAPPEKSPRFRGVLADRLCTTEPETEGSEHNWRRHPRLSLLPSWAVRFRPRFALAGFGQKRAVPRVRILACQAGESDSLAIRLSEEQSTHRAEARQQPRS